SQILTTAIQSDGKLIIGGQFTLYNGVARNQIARLNPDGSLDTSFDPGTGATSFVFTTAIQADGKIIIGGIFTEYNGVARNFIARLNGDGSLDTDFNPGTGANSQILTTAIQSDGKLIIGGDFTSYDGVSRVRINRLQNTVGPAPDTEAPEPDLEELPVFEAQCVVNLADLTIPTATDNVDGTIEGTTDESLFPITTQGSTIITWTYTDAAGNTTTQTQEILIIDTEAPVIMNPGDIQVNTDPGSCEADINLPLPEVTDNCDTGIVPFGIRSDGLALNAPFPVGITSITWSAEDASGNQAEEIFQTISVLDTEAPQITCPTDITVTAPVAANGVEVFYDLPIVSDNCGEPALQLITGFESGTFFNIGITTVTYRATDTSGNSTECSFTVTVLEGEDTEAPVISDCPENITVFNDEGSCGAIVSWTEPTATDNSGFASLFTDKLPGSFFHVGTTTVTYTATDASGNTSICSFDVTVINTEKPVIVGTEFYTQVNNAGTCFATLFNLGTVSASAFDNCGSYEPNGVRSDGLALDAPYPVGTTTITWSAVNDSGIAADDFIQTIVITDSEKPVIDWPVHIEVNTDPGNCEALVSIVPPAVTDNCDTALVLVGVRDDGLSLNDPYPIGFTTITWSTQDASGNQAQEVEQYITVNDREKPVILPPAPITLFADVNFCQSFETVPFPNATDNCSSEFTFFGTRSDGLSLVNGYPIGETVISWTAFDQNGNVSDPVEQTVIVIDNLPPTFFSCPGNIEVEADLNENGKAVFYDMPIPLDNCVVIDFQLISGLNSGSVFPVGTTTVTYRAIDGAGNSTDCSFTVTVTENADTEDPVISDCPADISVSNDPGSCGAVVTWTAPTATDNSGSVNLISNFAPGSFFPVGSTTVTYTASDAAGNTSVCSFIVTVTDNEKPVILPPAPITLSADVNFCQSFETVPFPNATDNCSVEFFFTGTRSDGLSLVNGYPVGETVISWVATDLNGNQSDPVTQTVIVIDNLAPTFIICPGNIEVEADLNESGKAVFYDNATAFDNCGVIDFQLVAGFNSGSVFPIGTTEVIYRATDEAGNSTECSFTVTVTENADTEDPVISDCPMDISVSNDAGSCGAIVNWTAPTATDNSGSVTLTSNFEPGSFFPVGSTTVTYTATDAAGNTAICSFAVTVSDNQKPVIAAISPIAQAAPAGSCEAIINIPVPAVNDNCSTGLLAIGTRSDGLALNDAYPLGTTTITWTAEDAAGNEADPVIQTVTVTDTEAPVITCPADISTTVAFGETGAVVTYAQPTATDNCGTPSVLLISGPASGSVFPIGTTTVTYRATDASGNSVDCSFTVTVTESADTEDPVISDCPADFSVSNDTGSCGAIVNWTAPTATDNSGSVNLTSNFEPGSFFPVGSTTVTYTAT
ncbi:HYR domain-containing protein, partial [Cecembia lonarensis]|uniref:HYR domain-containing protein n=1 Tax=Cecembia lonarensis TaxID=645110 RepID=UPI00058B9F65